MKTAIDRTGRLYGHLTVQAQGPRTKANKTQWHCICVCGEETLVSSSNLQTGHTTSCGCVGKASTLTHGLYNTPEYSVWRNMKARCTNTKNPRYSDYLGRGIKICAEWFSFEAFYEDMGSRPSYKHSLDRIDNDKGYSPDNCRWATNKEQAINKRNTKLITYKGESLTAADWSRRTGIHRSTIASRLSRGKTVEEALEVYNA